MTDDRFYCQHCGLRIYLDGSIWRHHRSNHGDCNAGLDTMAEPIKNPAAVALGRLGGLASKGKTSEAKKKASRENGKKGGWPKGKPRKPPNPPAAG